MKFSIVLALLLMAPVLLLSQDVIFRTNGQTSGGKVIGIQAPYLRVEVPLSPDQPNAIVSISLADIDHVDFGETAEVEKYLDKVTQPEFHNVEKLWWQRQSLLELPESTAGAFALKMGNLLMESRLKQNYRLALQFFRRVERKDWSEKRRLKAREGRLRALVKLGRADEAVAEAARLAVSSEDPELVIEAKFVLAQASKNALEMLVEDNPRWIEDDEVRPERDKLYHRTLDLFLFAHLFHGDHTEQAARGLWNAIKVYQEAGESDQAFGRAGDLLAIYPDTRFARDAEKLIQKQNRTTAAQ
jgi:hypothetical protein